MGRLSPERVREELDKVLSGSKRPSAALSLYAVSGVLAFFYPELDASVAPSGLRSSEPSRWTCALRAVDQTSAGDVEGRLALLLAATGQTASAVAILTRLRTSNRRIREVGALAGALALVLEAGGSWAPNAPERRQWLSHVGSPLVPRLIPLLGALRAAWTDEEAPRTVQRLQEAVVADLRARIPLSVDGLGPHGS
jgi:tRNA nucleotidyltransferase/poly(A) polymerase